MLTITITDTNTERYTYTASANILGRRYDNIAEYVSVVKPESETGRDCIMIVTYGDTVVDHIPVGDTPIAITSNLSQYASVKIGFAFLGADGYIKNSEVKQFFFLTAQKPDGFVPLPPVQKTTVEYLLSHGFTNAKLENNILSFTNAAGEAVAEIKLSGFIQEQADWNEADPTAETYIKNKPTKLSEFTNDSGFVTGAAIAGKADKSYVDTELAKKQPTGDYATRTELSQGLSEKQPVGNYATTESLNAHTGNTSNPHSVTKSQVGLENVANERQYSSQNPPPYPVTSVAGRTGAVTLSKTDVGLSNVDNTSDTDKPVSTAQAAAIAEAKQAGTNAQNAINTHAAKVDNPHNVTAAQVGAYVKPSTGIPETDLSAEVQNKLNAGGAENLLRGDVTMTYAQGTNDGSFLSLGYALGIEVGKQYSIELTHNDEPLTVTGRAIDFQTVKVLAAEGSTAETLILIRISDTDSLGFACQSGVNLSGEAADDTIFVLDTHKVMTTIAHTVVFKSITEVEEVVADKVKNPLKITVNGEQKTYDGSKAVDVNIDTSGGATGDNVLQADVTFTSMAAILDYALNLEIGKLYKLNWTFNGISYSQTTYCWKGSDNITKLGTMDAGGGGEAILINPDNASDGTMIVMDKMYANPATEESYPSENNATILAVQNYANLIIQSIKEVGTYTPPIPIPTIADDNKILQVQGTHYTLTDLPAGTQSLYRHDVQIMSIDGSNRPAFAQCVILDYSPVIYNYDRLFSLIQKMTTITAVGTVVVERSDGKKTQGNVVGIGYDSSDLKIKIMSTYIDSDTSTSISQNDFEVPSNYQIYDYVTKIE